MNDYADSLGGDLSYEWKQSGVVVGFGSSSQLDTVREDTDKFGLKVSSGICVDVNCTVTGADDSEQDDYSIWTVKVNGQWCSLSAMDDFNEICDSDYAATAKYGAEFGDMLQTYWTAVANADANRLKQVFMNILDNALKYSRAPSKIFVKAEFTKLENENFVKIAIADQGCGISKEDLPHVKEKFYKANVSVRGSGIGLAVTNEIVNLHHGKLEIDSKEGKGTLVTIYLPVENSPSKNELNDMKQNATQADAEINEGVEINKN